MSNLGKIVYLSEAQLTTLISNGTITVGNETITYSENDIYMTPNNSGLPLGGNEGEVLAKISSADYDMIWVERVPPELGGVTLNLNPGSGEGWIWG